MSTQIIVRNPVRLACEQVILHCHRPNVPLEPVSFEWIESFQGDGTLGLTVKATTSNGRESVYSVSIVPHMGLTAAQVSAAVEVAMLRELADKFSIKP